jgi:hypothetical protein
VIVLYGEEIRRGVDAVKWLEWFLVVHLVVLVIVGEIVSLTSFVMLMVWVLKKKYLWLFRH